MEYSNFKQAGTMVNDYGNEPLKTLDKPRKKKLQTEKVTIDADEFPYLQKLKIGSECELKVKIKKTGERTAEEYETTGEEKDHKITLEIVSIAEPKPSNAAYKELIKEGSKNTEDE